MAFPKGAQSKGGRTGKRGPSAETVALRQRVEQLLDENWDQIKKDLTELSAKERVDAYIRLLDFALPRLQRIDSSVYEAQEPMPILSFNGLLDHDNGGSPTKINEDE